jgi:hypothetical protein
LLVQIIISIVFIVFFSFSGIISIVTASPGFQIFTKDSSPFGNPYSDWVEKWWIWWAGIPSDKHPVNNYFDSDRCSIMQNGPVWFLPDVIPGQSINYKCNIPVGKAILLPITTTFCEKAPKGSCGSMLSDKELKESADNILTPLQNMKIIVDGLKVDISGSPVKTNFFNLTFPNNPIDIWGTILPGSYKAVATGYFLFLHDLSPGKHEIELRIVDLLKGNEGPPPRFDPLREGKFEIFVK